MYRLPPHNLLYSSDLLQRRQVPACGHKELKGNEVESRGHLCNWMLDLKASVDLEEEPRPGFAVLCGTVRPSPGTAMRDAQR